MNTANVSGLLFNFGFRSAGFFILASWLSGKRLDALENSLLVEEPEQSKVNHKADDRNQ